ncbi:hypothetical protein CPB86DRAFT_823272 [Serendipita vermifera]|nr:hypothetical protein CPB86DRAFT_823272 [Serendipita vermifera]
MLPIVGGVAKDVVGAQDREACIKWFDFGLATFVMSRSRPQVPTPPLYGLRRSLPTGGNNHLVDTRRPSYMEFRIAKPRIADIRKGSPIVSRSEAVACGLCKKNPAKYSCPDCNVPYCSLECFQGEEHRTCSEEFYRTMIQEEIQSDPGRTSEEKRNIISILQRVNEPDTVDDPEDQERDLANKLDQLDINSADTTQLWEVLTPAQKEEFMKAMEDPNSSLARQLLDTLDADENERLSLPWWEASPEEEGVMSARHWPDPISIPLPLIESSDRGWKEGQPNLLYNILAVCVTYVFCIRTLRIMSVTNAEPHDVCVCRELFAQAVPFLTDRQSTVRLKNVQESITFVESRLKEPLRNLLSDVTLLFRPSLVSEVRSPLEEASYGSPQSKLITCLGDLQYLFESSASHEIKSRSHSNPHEATTTQKGSGRPKAVVHKLTFYGAHVKTAPMTHILDIINELRAYLSTESKGQDDIDPAYGAEKRDDMKTGLVVDADHIRSSAPIPKIEEIP